MKTFYLHFSFFFLISIMSRLKIKWVFAYSYNYHPYSVFMLGQFCNQLAKRGRWDYLLITLKVKANIQWHYKRNVDGLLLKEAFQIYLWNEQRLKKSEGLRKPELKTWKTREIIIWHSIQQLFTEYPPCGKYCFRSLGYIFQQRGKQFLPSGRLHLVGRIRQ